MVADTTSPRFPLTITPPSGAFSPFAFAKASASARSCWTTWARDGILDALPPALPRPSQSATAAATSSAPAMPALCRAVISEDLRAPRRSVGAEELVRSYDCAGRQLLHLPGPPQLPNVKPPL